MRRPFIFLALFILFYGCAGTAKETLPEAGLPFSVTDVSEGLPTDGLWRESFVLYDVKGDGFSAIIAPPPRKAKPEERRPFIFAFDGKEKRWSEVKYSFPPLAYDYGSVSVGDINRDGLFDIVLATHSGKIFVLINNGDGSFRDMPFPIKEEFHSRAIRVADVNGDGWPDIVAVSESQFARDYYPKGLLVAINREGKDWDIKLVKDSDRVPSDSLSIGDINGDGKPDIAIAPLTEIQNEKKALWLGDGSGAFTYYPHDFGETYPYRVVLGDIDGDGRDEIIFALSALGRKKVKEAFLLKAYKWSPQGLVDISEGLPVLKRPLAFETADLDGDGRKEIILLAEDGLHLLKYGPSGWVELQYRSIPLKDTYGARDLKIAPQRDGSFMVVYSLGLEDPLLSRGFKAYLLRPKK